MAIYTFFNFDYGQDNLIHYEHTCPICKCHLDYSKEETENKYWLLVSFLEHYCKTHKRIWNTFYHNFNHDNYNKSMLCKINENKKEEAIREIIKNHKPWLKENSITRKNFSKFGVRNKKTVFLLDTIPLSYSLSRLEMIE